MRKYSMRKCKGIGEVAVIEAAEIGRKRKVVGGCADYSTSLVQLRRNRRRLVAKLESSKEKETSTSNDPCASCCSSNGSTELDKESSKFLDLEEESVERSTSTYEDRSCRERRETTLSSEVQAESGEMESTGGPLSEENSSRRSTDEKMPSDSELENFFSAAEKSTQKQFADKYNFDFSKEEPLEGRYEWVRIIKP